jgi:hypothetical protein
MNPLGLLWDFVGSLTEDHYQVISIAKDHGNGTDDTTRDGL